MNYRARNRPEKFRGFQETQAWIEKYGAEESFLEGTQLQTPDFPIMDKFWVPLRTDLNFTFTVLQHLPGSYLKIFPSNSPCLATV